jgi:fatty-acyl-CoA synthase
MGEVGVAWVVLDDATPTDMTELLEYCAGRLARFKVPAHIVPIPADQLPTSASGKVQKFRLAERAQELLTV